MKNSRRDQGSSAGAPRKPSRPAAASAGRKAAGIKDIAKAAGVSIGTVDRALHARAGISAATRARILKTASRLGYRRNLAASYLKLGRQRKILMHLPEEIASYFDAVRAGVLQAAERLQPPVEVELHSYPRMGHGEAESIEALLDRPCDGMILAPSSPSKIGPLIRMVTSRNIPVVCVATDAPDSGRLTAISTDAFTSGAIAAELFTRLRKAAGEAAIITGDLATFDHSEKVRGFRSMLSDLGGVISLVEVAETHDEYPEAYRRTHELLARHRNVSGIYVSTANSLAVIKALEDGGRLPDVDLVVTDLFPELVPLIRTGRVFASLYQRPFTQGRLAFEALHRFIVEGIRPLPVYKLPPYIALRSNIDVFTDDAVVRLDDDSPLITADAWSEPDENR
jgi:LacI family transcriptional regulator